MFSWINILVAYIIVYSKDLCLKKWKLMYRSTYFVKMSLGDFNAFDLMEIKRLGQSLAIGW